MRIVVVSKSDVARAVLCMLLRVQNALASAQRDEFPGYDVTSITSMHQIE